MIRFQCPNCGKAQTAPDANAGESGMCSYCDELFDIPSPKPTRPAVLRLVCPGCDKTLGVPAAGAGKPSTCPSCGTRFMVPEDLEPEPAHAPKPRPRPTPPPPRRPEPRRARDEDDDEPVSRRRRVDDDDDDDDEDDRPARRSKGKSKKRRGSRGGGGGLPDWYRGPLGRLAENAAITLVLAVLALFAPGIAGGLLMAWGFTLGMVGGIWSLVISAKEGVDQLLLNLFIPFYWAFYMITRWEKVKLPGTLYLVGFVQYVVGILILLAPLMAMLRELNGDK